MGTLRSGRLLGFVALAALGCAAAPAQEKAVQDRVEKLLAVIADPEARGAKLTEANAARRELTEIGGPAAPQLVEAVVTLSPPSNVGYWAGQLLLEIGKPALPAMRARWPDLNDERRWRLVPTLEKHDPGTVKEYAYNCLDADGPAVRVSAWHFVMLSKDPRAKERFFAALSGEGGKEPPYLRSRLLPLHFVVYDEERENKLLIGLHRFDSWVAKGEGQPFLGCEPPPWWPDGRPDVIRTLHARKVVRAAPALLDVLTEKGPGAGYLATQIIPVLADLGREDVRVVPELERIVASKPGPGENVHRYTGTEYKAVRQLAADAIKRLNEAKP